MYLGVYPTLLSYVTIVYVARIVANSTTYLHSVWFLEVAQHQFVKNLADHTTQKKWKGFN